jgi:hypothetical protein
LPHSDWILCLRVHRDAILAEQNCAVAAEQARRNPLILDHDDKGSAKAVYQLREAETPGLVRIGSWKLPVAMAAARSGGYDLVIIDTPRRDDPSVHAAVRARRRLSSG